MSWSWRRPEVRTGRPRRLTESMRRRARRVARSGLSSPRRRQLARAVLEHDSVTAAAEALSLSPDSLYSALRS